MMKTRLVAIALTGLAAGLLVAVIGLPYGRINPSAFAELYHGQENTSGFVHIAVDCDTTTQATESHCSYGPILLPSSIQAGVTLSNSTGSNFRLAAFGFTLSSPNTTRIVATTTDNPGAFDDNPDFNQASIAGVGWECAPPPPEEDADPFENGDQSFIACFNSNSDGPIIPADASNVTLAFVNYDVQLLALPGVTQLVLRDVSVFDATFTEVASCRPVNITEGKCFDATIEFSSIGFCENDHECDGHLDFLPPGHPGPTNLDPNFDNCPVSIPNGDQQNADGNFFDHSPPYAEAVDDRTRVNSDGAGDHCDDDIDNDGLPQTLLLELPCNGLVATSAFDEDSDDDRILDGVECALGTDPMDAMSKPPTPPVAQDADRDRLTDAQEATIGTDPNDADSDDDGLQDGWEYLSHGSDPLDAETDDDGVNDGCEVASLNGDTIVNVGDQALLASEVMRPVPPSEKIANMDLNRDGAINVGDQAFQASMAIPGKC